jgi:hypothetical protein
MQKSLGHVIDASSLDLDLKYNAKLCSDFNSCKCLLSLFCKIEWNHLAHNRRTTETFSLPAIRQLYQPIKDWHTIPHSDLHAFQLFLHGEHFIS